MCLYTSVRCLNELLGSPVISISPMNVAMHAFQLEFIKFEWETLSIFVSHEHGYTG